MPLRKFDPSEVRTAVLRTYIDDSGRFLCDGDVTFMLDGAPSMTLPFKGATTRDEAIDQAATALERIAGDYVKVARRLLHP